MYTRILNIYHEHTLIRTYIHYMHLFIQANLHIYLHIYNSLWIYLLLKVYGKMNKEISSRKGWMAERMPYVKRHKECCFLNHEPIKYITRIDVNHVSLGECCIVTPITLLWERSNKIAHKETSELLKYWLYRGVKDISKYNSANI